MYCENCKTHVEYTGHWNNPEQLPPISEGGSSDGVWLKVLHVENGSIKCTKVKRTKVIQNGPRNIWTVEDTFGTVFEVNVIKWQYI